MFAIPYFELKTVYLFGSGIPFWMIMIWVSRIFALLVILIETKRLKLDKVVVIPTFILVLVLNQIFEKILFLISHKYLHSDGFRFSLFEWNHLGRVYFGSLIGTLLAVMLGALFAKKWDKIGQYLDVFFLANIVALFFYRIANILAHSHIGKITNFPLGMEYFGEVRHETSLYENLVLLFIIPAVWFLRKKIAHPGALSFLIVALISIMRFFLDFLRSDDLISSNFRFGSGLSLNQIAYFILFIFCGLAFFYLFKNHKKDFFIEGWN